MRLFLLIALTICSKNYHCASTRRLGQPTTMDNMRQYPFFAHIQIPVFKRPLLAKRCGASLVHPQWILTAAQCFPTNSKAIDWVLKQRVPMVYMGSNKSYSLTAQTRTFIEIHPHPNYTRVDPTVLLNDIAVAKLSKPYELTPMIQTIRLPISHGVCTLGVIIGIGKTNIDTKRSPTKNVQYARVLITQRDGRKSSRYQSTSTFYTETPLNTTKLKRGYFLPQGDYGGPFVCYFPHFPPILFGVQSLAFVTNKRTVINVYEKVFPFKEFISRYVPPYHVVKMKRSAKARLGANASNVITRSTMLSFIAATVLFWVVK